MSFEEMLEQILWEEPKIVQTKEGIKSVQKAELPEGFWGYWKIRKEEIKAMDISVSKYKNEWQLNRWGECKFREQANYSNIEIDENKLKGLKPYQIEAVKFLESVNGIGGIFDQQRIGKTIESIGYFILHPEIRPVICVVPATVKIQWQREIYKWTKEKAIILSGLTPYELKKADWYIINYDILATEKNEKLYGWYKELTKIGQAIIGDEIQKIGNEETIRTRAFKYMAKRILKKKNSSLIPLSGTPIRGKPKEFFNILNLLDSVTFNSSWNYKWLFCSPEHNGFGWSFDGASNIETLNKMIQPLMIRRLRKDVIKDMPDKQKTIVPLELEKVARKNYMEADLEFKKWVAKLKWSEAEGHISHLKQLAYLAKRKNVISWIKDFLEFSREKLVVGVYHKKVITDLMKEFKDTAVKLDGSCSDKERQKAIDKFQTDDKCKLFFGQIIAAGLGVNLSASSSVAFVEYPDVPADLEQFEDRIVNTIDIQDNLNIYYLVGEGTIDEDIVEMLNTKDDVVHRVVDGKEGGELFGEDKQDFLDGLLNKYKGE
jgi:SWI/SNF-related matrix-associated actin-dependent regulator 1 of chromatin subfamily A